MTRVLVVDDNRAIRETLADALSWEGFAVDLAVDGDAAVAAVLRAPPDVVLLDLMLPGSDGATVAGRLRASGCVAPIAVMTADRLGGERARELGAAAFLAKPFDFGALLDVLAQLAPAREVMS